MPGEVEIRNRFIEEEDAPSGKWVVEFPLGLRAQSTGQITAGSEKRIDAVCFPSLPHELPAALQYKDAPAHFTRNLNNLNTIGLSDLESGRFAGEDAVIVEVKSGAPNLKGIGQLVAYRELIEDEWDVNVVDMLLVANGEDFLVGRACDRLGIKMVPHAV